jgi:hypothetical protein
MDKIKKPEFVQILRSKKPTKDERKKLIKNFKRNGVEYEADVKDQYKSIKKRIAYFSKEHKMIGEWIYVGYNWWCRKITDYEFAKIYAQNNTTLEEEPWDDKFHKFENPPTIVLRDVSGNKEKGFLVGYNEFELLIEWIDPITKERKHAIPIRDVENISFEWLEHYKKYRKIIANILKSRKKGS